MAEESLIGTYLGRYRIVDLLGKGGMAEVYKGYQESLDRHVAIKLMHGFLTNEEEFLHRFQREARALARLSHPNIVSVFDFDVYEEDSYYLVMEYISGGTLKDRIEALTAAGERLPIDEAVEIILQVTQALSYAHQRNMVHRDIKPANIMIDETGKAILTDFGIVKKLADEHSVVQTATGALIGTPAYMSPEQALGQESDKRSDIYSMGVMMFQMVTGQLPFSAETPIGVVMKHVNEQVPLPVTFNPQVPAKLQEIIVKSLAKDPNDRYQSARELIAALRQVNMKDAAISPAPPPAPTPAEAATAPSQPKAEELEPAAAVGDTTATAAEMPQKRPTWLYALIGVVALVIIGGAIIFAGGGLLTEGEPTELPVAVVDPTESPTATPPRPTATNGPQADTPTPEDTPDTVATVLAAAEQTRAAEPTETPTPTNTATITATPTPDLTATFRANCTVGVALLDTWPYSNRNLVSVVRGANFPINWEISNEGTCPLTADLEWAYVEGETFAYDGGLIPLDVELAAGESTVLTASFIAPNTIGTYEAVWQLQDSSGNPVGDPLSFTIGAVAAATATPVATPTSAEPTVEASALNYLAIVQSSSCRYQGSDWECTVEITPFGGGGGPYTVFIFDQAGGQATTFRTTEQVPPFIYFAKARRCASYNQEVRVIDDATGTDFSRNLFLNPNDHFNCEEE